MGTPSDAVFPEPEQMDRSRLVQIVEECAQTHGAHLIDVLVRGERGSTVMEVFIDSADGVTTETCAEVSREITGVPALEETLGRGSRIVVSSPGIERPLKFPWQYGKHIGRQMRIRVRDAEGTSESHGRLIMVDDRGITLQEGTNQDVFTFDSIVDAIVKTPW